MTTHGDDRPARVRASRCGANDPFASLILPAGLFGPVYRDGTDSNERRAAWVRFQRWINLLLGGLPALAFIVVAEARWPERGPLIALEHPVLLWSALAAVTALSWLAGLAWARVQGARLTPVARRSTGLDERLEAHFLPTPKVKVTAIMAMLAANGLLIAVIAIAALFLHPWIFGPWAALQAIWSLGFFRACLLRRRREAGRGNPAPEAAGA